MFLKRLIDLLVKKLSLYFLEKISIKYILIIAHVL